MRNRKRKSNLSQKLCISLITNNRAKRSKVKNANTLLHMLGTDLDLKDYAQLHAKTHCKTVQQDNIMCDLMVLTILTQYHV